ncbi:MAG TPA: hypothetical protein DIC56_06775 [Rhizobium sp.]|nr:hypothetical protein [Rhizobium sp.]
MLSPVHAVSNSTVSYQDQRLPHEQANTGAGQPQPTAYQAPAMLDRNSVVAGRLNLLLLSGSERMAENLAMVADLLGQNLGIYRREGETNSSLASRLMEAIGKLPRQERAAVQRQLSQMFSGIQLRTLIEAFRNPAGPDAAKLAVYLELNRHKDKDLAARTVVSSYRQNAGDPRPVFPPTVRPTTTGFLEAPEEASMPAIVGRPATKGQEPKATTPVPLRPALDATRVFDPPGDRMTAPAQVTDGLSEGNNEATAAKRSAPQQIRGDDLMPQTKAEGTRAPVAGEDIRALQDRLRLSYEASNESEADGAPGGDRGNAMREIPTRVALRQGSGEKGSEITRVDAPSAIGQQRADAIQRPSRMVQDQAAAEQPQTLFVLKGWREVTTLPPILRDTGDIGRAAVSQAEPEGAASRGSAMVKPDPDTTEGKQPEARLTEAHSPQNADPSTARPQTATPASPTAEVVKETAAESRSALQSVASQQETPGNEPATARPQAALREGVPLPQFNYLVAEDYAERKGPELRRRFEDDRGDEGHTGDQQMASDEDAADQGDGQDESRGLDAPGTEEAGEISFALSPSGSGADAAHDFYLRMASWS